MVHSLKKVTKRMSNLTVASCPIEFLKAETVGVVGNAVVKRDL